MKLFLLPLMSIVLTSPGLATDNDFKEISPEQEERILKRKILEAEIIQRTREEIRNLQARQEMKKSSDPEAFSKWLASKGMRTIRKPSSVPKPEKAADQPGSLSNLSNCKGN